METDRHLFRKCLLYGQVSMTWAERHSLVPPGPAAPSVATIVRPCFHLAWHMNFQLSWHCVSKDTLSLALSAETIDRPFNQAWKLGLCVLLISGVTTAYIRILPDANGCICCWPSNFASWKWHLIFLFFVLPCWHLLSWTNVFVSSGEETLLIA